MFLKRILRKAGNSRNNGRIRWPQCSCTRWFQTHRACGPRDEIWFPSKNPQEKVALLTSCIRNKWEKKIQLRCWKGWLYPRKNAENEFDIQTWFWRFMVQNLQCNRISFHDAALRSPSACVYHQTHSAIFPYVRFLATLPFGGYTCVEGCASHTRIANGVLAWDTTVIVLTVLHTSAYM